MSVLLIGLVMGAKGGSLNGSAAAQGRGPELAPIAYTLYGTPGLIDMPTAEMQPDAELAFSLSHSGAATRGTLTFQIHPSLTGSFRYARIPEGGGDGGELFDRSFDLRWRFAREGRVRPALALGLNDFIGTGVYSGEYVVATKTVSPRLRATMGIGWGRLGTDGGFRNPLGLFGDRFETRPADRRIEEGGGFEAERFFRGDAALFGGVTYRLGNDVDLKVEYSSDAYPLETRSGDFGRRSPVNLGIDWRLRAGARLQGALLHGEELALGLTIATNPKRPAVVGGSDPAPPPVLVRGAAPRAAASDAFGAFGPHAQSAVEVGTDGASADGDVEGHADTDAALLATTLKGQGIVLEGFRLHGGTARVLIRTGRYDATPQAVGRTARVMTRVLPVTVEAFEIVPVADGMPTVAVTLRRSDVEALENAPDAAWRSYLRARITGGADAWHGTDVALDAYPRLRWSVGPYVSLGYFDPESPVRADVGIRARAAWRPAPGWTVAGTVRARAFGNRDGGVESSSELPRVRVDTFRYLQNTVSLATLHASYRFRPADALYARATGGYLELGYAGISTELLWKPARSRLGLGVEMNYALQRDFDDPFGLRDYDVVTGHASAYLRLPGGFDTQLDVGRYLAGDVGATLAVDRSFANGWRVGAFATKTDVSSEAFGEGSFDKGLRLRIPLDHFVGRETGRRYETTLRPILRDGGARLNVPGRLYEQVRDDHDPELRREWGLFWR